MIVYSYCHFVNCSAFVFVGFFPCFPFMFSCGLMTNLQCCVGLFILCCVCLSCIFSLQLPWGFDIAFYICEQDCCMLLIFEFQMCLCSPPLTIASFSIMYVCVVEARGWFPVLTMFALVRFFTDHFLVSSCGLLFSA